MLTKEDLVQIKGVIKETVEEIVDRKIDEKVAPRFERIEAKLAEYDAHFEGIFFAFDKLETRVENLEKDVREIKKDLKITQMDTYMLKTGHGSHELRINRLEEKVFSE